MTTELLLLLLRLFCQIGMVKNSKFYFYTYVSFPEIRTLLWHKQSQQYICHNDSQQPPPSLNLATAGKQEPKTLACISSLWAT